jgi:nucleoside-diphosphate-sugar epimerase
MKAVITGDSGLLGRPTVNAFKNAGYDGNKKKPLV